jgi:hypothetical protein
MLLGRAVVQADMFFTPSSHPTSAARRPRPYLAWATLLFIAGIACAASLPEPHPLWAVFVLGIQGAVHALAVAGFLWMVCALVLRVLPPRAARVVCVLLVTSVVLFAALDARTYGITGQHIDRSTFGHVFEAHALDVLGVQPRDLVEIAVFSISMAVIVALSLRRVRAPSPALRLLAVFVCADLAFLGFGAVVRYRGIQPLLGLDHAMPFSSEVRNDALLGKLLGGVPQAIDDDFQFPSPTRLVPTIRQLREPSWPAQAERRPDILLVSIESLRSDALDAMPNLRAFRERALVATRHYSGGNCSFLGEFSLLSGLDPLYWPVSETGRAPAGLSAFQSLGYRVAFANSAALAFSMREKVLEGHESDLVPLGPSASPTERDEANTRWIERWARESRTGPSFAVMFFDASHWPYWADGETPPSLGLGTSWDRLAEADTFRRKYLRSLTDVDRRLGRILQALRDAGREDSTVVVITGDHGEAFAEHGVFGHGSRMDEEQIHVPLAMRLPGVAPGHIDQLSVHQDVLPTLLGYLGATPHRTMKGVGIDLRNDETRLLPPLVGSCGIGQPVGYAALVDDHKVLFQFDRSGTHYVSTVGRHDMLLPEAPLSPPVGTALRGIGESFLATTKPG